MMLSLARRFDTVTAWVALAIVCALLAVQAVSLAFKLTTSPREIPFVGMRWLSGSIADIVASANAADGAFSGAPSARISRFFTVKRIAQPVGPSPMPSDELAANLRRMIESALRERRVVPQEDAIRIGFRGPPHLGPPRAKPSVVDGTVVVGDADFILPAMVEVQVRLGDGSWIVVSGRRAATEPWRRYLWIGSLLASAVLVGLCSWWMARRLILPLRRLSQAADRLDGLRSAGDVPETGPVELRRIAYSFNAMQGRLLALVAERTRMAAAVSHDLRTPITRLRLRAEYVGDTELQDSIIRDLATMERIVESTMRFAQTGVSSEAMQRIELHALLDDLCAGLSVCGTPIDHQFDGTAVVDAPLDGLERAFANLIGNAAKFGTRVSVRLCVEARQAEIVIDDNGPGIDDALKAKVFEPFFRADAARSVDSGGAGLGLTIASAVIVRCGGTIELRDRIPTGLSVRVTLPCVAANRSPPVAADSRPSSRASVTTDAEISTSSAKSLRF